MGRDGGQEVGGGFLFASLIAAVASPKWGSLPGLAQAGHPRPPVCTSILRMGPSTLPRDRGPPTRCWSISAPPCPRIESPVSEDRLRRNKGVGETILYPVPLVRVLSGGLPSLSGFDSPALLGRGLGSGRLAHTLQAPEASLLKEESSLLFVSLNKEFQPAGGNVKRCSRHGKLLAPQNTEQNGPVTRQLHSRVYTQ